MADHEDRKDKTVPELVKKPVATDGQTPAALAAKLKDLAAGDIKPSAGKPFEPDLKAATLSSIDAAPAKFSELAKAAPKPVAAKAPIASANAPAAPIAKASVSKTGAAQLPAAKALADAVTGSAPVTKVKPAPKPKIKAAAPVRDTVPSPSKPIEHIVPAKVAPTKPVIEVAKDVESAVAPVTVPKAAIPNAAPKTAPTKPVFAGLFSNFTFEEKTMDMSTNFAGLQDAMTEAQAKAKAAFEKSTSVLGEVSEFTKGNVEAVVASGKILAEGAQGIGSELVAEGRTAFETLTGDIKELAAAKSPTDFFKIQSDMVRKNFDSAVAYSSKNSEAMLKLFSDSFAPISGRMSIAMEKARAVSI